MRGVEIRDGTKLIRGERIHEPAPGRSDIVDAAKVEARGSGGDVDGFGIGVVEVELHTVANLFFQRDLQTVVIGSADGTPGEAGCELLVQEFAAEIARRMAVSPAIDKVGVTGSVREVAVEINVTCADDLVANIGTRRYEEGVSDLGDVLRCIPGNEILESSA